MIRILERSFFVLLLVAHILGCCSFSATVSTPTSTVLSQSELRLLSRQISKCNSAEQAMSMVSHLKLQLTNNKVNDEAFVAAMRVFGKEKRPDLALHLYKNLCQTENCRTLAISICGKNGHKNDALELLRCGPEAPSVASYNSAIAACNHDRESWKDALDILNSMPSNLISNLSCNAVLSVLAKARKGREARKILSKMEYEDDYPNPDLTSYHKTITAFLWSKNQDTAFEILVEMESSKYTSPIMQTYDMVANSFGKTGNFSMANLIENRRKRKLSGHDNSNDTVTMSNREPSIGHAYYQFEHWDFPGLTKVQGSKHVSNYWEFGRYSYPQTNIIVALQPHRNPSKNGIKLLFFRDDQQTRERTKIGFLLMINSPEPGTGTSKFLGMFLDPSLRGGGLSKVCLAMWMHLCLKANIKPMTGIMNKPLLCLVLQHKFRWVPVDKRQGIDAEIGSGDGGSVVLYSSRSKSLAGAFSPSDLKHQNIILSEVPSNPRGRLTRIRAALEPPADDDEFQRIVDSILFDATSETGFSYEISPGDIRRVMLGQ